MDTKKSHQLDSVNFQQFRAMVDHNNRLIEMIHKSVSSPFSKEYAKHVDYARKMYISMFEDFARQTISVNCYKTYKKEIEMTLTEGKGYKEVLAPKVIFEPYINSSRALVNFYNKFDLWNRNKLMHMDVKQELQKIMKKLK